MQRLSFVVPLKDDPLVDRLLGSLSRQTARDFEVVIIDSSDGNSCNKALERWASHLDTQVVSAKGGRGTARNIGAKLAKGEVLAFVDADVYLPHTFAERMLKLFGNDPRLVAVGFPIYPTKVNKVSQLVYRVLRFLDERSYHYGKPRIPTTCAVYRRSVFDSRFFTDLIGEDVLFSADILRFGTAAYAKQIRVFEEPRRWEKGSRILSSLWHYFPSYVISFLIVTGLHNFLMPKQELKGR